MREIKIIDCDGGVVYLWGEPIKLQAVALGGSVDIFLSVTHLTANPRAYRGGDSESFAKYDRDIEKLFLDYVINELGKERVLLDFSNEDFWHAKVEKFIQEITQGGEK